MDHETRRRIIAMLNQSSIYVPLDSDGYKIDFVEEDEDIVYCTDENTGEQYRIHFEEINLEKDLFYKLVLVDPSTV